MKTGCLVVLGVSMMLCAAACTRGPKGLSRARYTAIENGLPALERAYEYRDSGAIAFEPRMLDAEHALDEVRASGSNNASGTSAWLIFKSAVESLQIYRRNLAALIERQNESGTAFKKINADRMKMKAEMSEQMAKDISLLKGYLY